MNRTLDRLRRIAGDAWLKFLKYLNSLILLACGGVVMFNQVNPNFINTLTALLTPTQQAIAGFIFCCIVQYALRRISRQGATPTAPTGPALPSTSVTDPSRQ